MYSILLCFILFYSILHQYLLLLYSVQFYFCSNLFYYVLVYSFPFFVLFCSILSQSVLLIYSVQFYLILFCPAPVYYTLFCSMLPYFSVLFYSILCQTLLLFYSVLFYIIRFSILHFIL